MTLFFTTMNTAATHRLAPTTITTALLASPMSSPCKTPLRQTNSLTSILPKRPSTLTSPVQQQHAQRHAPLKCTAIAALTPALVFDAATFTVLPLYTLMVLAPKAKLTRRLMSSSTFYWLAGTAYAALLALWKIAPTAINIVKSMGLHKTFTLPSLTAFATYFGTPETTTLAWIHLVVLDLFQARWVYKDGLTHGVPTFHSIVLCFMVGPLGLVSHLLTRGVVGFVNRNNGGDNTVMYRF